MEKQVRVILWALPRTLSTAFLKCMNGVPDSKMFYEPYTTAYLFGPDRPYDSAPRPSDSSECGSVDVAGKPCDAVSGFDDSICTYKWVKEQLEAPFQGKQLIFCKDMAYCLNKSYEHLPQGYKFIFLIRHPKKVIPSWKKLISDYSRKKVEDFVLDELEPPIMPPEIGYGELLELFEYIKQQGLDAEPIVIDADDLLADPHAIMSACCKKTGVPYNDNLLTWEEGGRAVENWAVSKNLKYVIADAGSFDNVKRSSCFQKPDAGPEVSGGSEQSPDVQRFVEKCMPLYSKLYEVRLK
ncbi:branched-chain-amino-acid aminotransferase-like protein 2 [Patiria miniata]|uniref:Sulfotransferase family protein n=1 Tax=Patiria miniata TaxID=46514 RepID=A0A914AER2_PATMI|nr:branched-chain-amino-acid aminotransferase-like protein 2 [Patiria miniata]XP_038061990.1 branched-chain-amino-acid aminotransferase-like protein 2 [Patiria miniata]XP_038061991.1 branched-chain-amino-acid aminotransferase-like protein 2 [Patiria miniata]XP_038061992.1 branched-chain-amino-acid aminotransferase-like protein 2 [Patiria miniata]XP_038061993.1 branched-chain-amino-acid aminotransferase-like protein 2 [Patiria miniata]XP_038061994.1 branched-chain-amino-acid aminotransferase-li